ncbi:hypothetical protein N9D08_01150 [bacterium]|nr:hypothetical protein [bacterium]
MSDKDARSITRGERSSLLARDVANGARCAQEGVTSVLDEERGETDASARCRATTSRSRGCLVSVVGRGAGGGGGGGDGGRGGGGGRRREDERDASRASSRR